MTTGNDNRPLSNDDLLIQQFFAENQVEIADEGFTEQVMRSLPERSLRLNRIWTAICMVAGAVLVYTKLPELQLGGLRTAAWNSLQTGGEWLMQHLATTIQQSATLHLSQQSLTMAVVGIVTLTVMAVYGVATDERL